MFDAMFDPMTDPAVAAAAEPPAGLRRWLAAALSAASAPDARVPAAPFARASRPRRAAPPPADPAAGR